MNKPALTNILIPCDAVRGKVHYKERITGWREEPISRCSYWRKSQIWILLPGSLDGMNLKLVASLWKTKNTNTITAAKNSTTAFCVRGAGIESSQPPELKHQVRQSSSGFEVHRHAKWEEYTLNSCRSLQKLHLYNSPCSFKSNFKWRLKYF